MAGTPSGCAGVTEQAQPWRAPRNRDRPKPCQRPVAFSVQDADELRAPVLSCKAHLGGLVAGQVTRFRGPVTVEPVAHRQAVHQ